MSLLQSFWGSFLAELEKNQKKTPILYSILKQLKPIDINESTITLGCNSGQKFFLEKKKQEIEDALLLYGKKRLSVELKILEPKQKNKTEPLLHYTPSLEDVFLKAGLHAKYRFDNFAVSSSNQVAFAAAQAVSQDPGHSYNPLFLYGGVGVGKTHLAQAVGRLILEKNPEARVFFCPGEQFTNEIIEAIRQKATPRFRQKYRSLQLLIVDDIQFIAGKQTVQEEFFHTFNSVVSAGGQIILTSDRPPSDIQNLEDRLRSRFSGGLIVDVQEPDFELRCAILLIKASEKKIEIDIEAAKIIAEQIEDTRALEGVLLSIYAKTLGVKEKIDLETVDAYFSQSKKIQQKKVLPSDVIRMTCSYYDIPQSAIRGSIRTERVALARQVCMYILREILRINLVEVAVQVRRKDHTTVIHAVDKVSRLMAKDPSFKEEVDAIIRTLGLST